MSQANSEIVELFSYPFILYNYIAAGKVTENALFVDIHVRL